MPWQRDDQLTAVLQSLLKYRRSKNSIAVKWQWKSLVWDGNIVNLWKKIAIVHRISENFAIFETDGWTRLRRTWHSFEWLWIWNFEQTQQHLLSRSLSLLYVVGSFEFVSFFALAYCISSQLNFYFRLSCLQSSRGAEHSS